MKNKAVLEGLLFVVGEEGLSLEQIEDVLELEELGLELIKFLITNEPDKVKARYGEWNDTEELIEIYNGFCRKRGFILRGGDVDYLRAGKGFLDDFRSGRVGKITLD